MTSTLKVVLNHKHKSNNNMRTFSLTLLDYFNHVALGKDE